MGTAGPTISKPKLNRLRQLAAQGHSKKHIAAIAGVSINTVDKYVSVDEVRRAPINTFKGNLSDLLHESLISAMSLQRKVLISLDEGDVPSLTVAEKKELLKATNTVFGTLYDKIRLQDGKSTVNSNHQIQVNQVHSGLFAPKPVEAPKGKHDGIMETVQPTDDIPQGNQEVQPDVCT